METETKRSAHPFLRLAVFGALFLLLTAAGVAWAVDASGLEVDQLARLGELPGPALGLVIALSVALLFAEMLRFRVVGAAVGVKVSWLACWDAMVANFFFAWITPGSAMAEPATIYMLGKRGVPWDAATVLCFGKSVSGLLLLLVTTFALLALGLGPELDAVLFLPFVSGTAVLAVVASALVVGSLYPDSLCGWLGRKQEAWSQRRLFSGPRMGRALTWFTATASESVRRLARFREGGFQGSLSVFAAHCVYYAMFVGVLVALAWGFEASSVSGVVPVAVIYQCFTYVLPTPGGSGFSEGTAVAFFGALLDPKQAVLVVLLFRALTFYSHVLLGLIYLPLVGGLRQVLERV